MTFGNDYQLPVLYLTRLLRLLSPLQTRYLHYVDTPTFSFSLALPVLPFHLIRVVQKNRRWRRTLTTSCRWPAARSLNWSVLESSSFSYNFDDRINYYYYTSCLGQRTQRASCTTEVTYKKVTKGDNFHDGCCFSPFLMTMKPFFQRVTGSPWPSADMGRWRDGPIKRRPEQWLPVACNPSNDHGGCGIVLFF